MSDIRLKRLCGQGWHSAVAGSFWELRYWHDWDDIWCDSVWGKTDHQQGGEATGSWIIQGRWDQLPLLSFIPSNSPLLSAHWSSNRICSLVRLHVAGQIEPTHACGGPPTESGKDWGSELLPSFRDRVWSAGANPSPTSSSPEVWQELTLRESLQLWVTSVNAWICVLIVRWLVLVEARLIGV